MTTGSVFEGMIRYSFVGVTFALVPMLCLLLLLHARVWIMDVLKTGTVRMVFQRLFEFSDKLDAKYVQGKKQQ